MKIALIVVVVAALFVLAAGQLGFFEGRMPDDLGVRDGLLKPPSRSENSASSQAARYQGDGARYAQIAPLRYTGDGAAALTRIGRIVMAMPGARIMRSGPDYLYVQFRTRWLKFVDDAEFWVDPAGGVIQVRSAARLGRKDFGVNRARIEAIRARMAAAG